MILSCIRMRMVKIDSLFNKLHEQAIKQGGACLSMEIRDDECR